MGLDLGAILKPGNLGFSDHDAIVSINIFIALLCSCIVIGHLLEGNRWVNESTTALLMVCSLLLQPGVCGFASVGSGLSFFSLIATCCLQGLITGGVILFATDGTNSRILVFSEDLFFIYLLPPIIFNAG